MSVLALVDRASGTMRSFAFDRATAENVHPTVRSNISREARLMTDEASLYRAIGREFAEHGTTLHSVGWYVDRKDRTIHTNTVEGAFSIFKRGMKGVYQHCGEQHLHRSLAEFEFRYNHRVANGVDDRGRAARCWTASLASASRIAGLTSTPKPEGKVGRRSSRWVTKAH